MAIGSPTEFLHDLGQLQVIARDHLSALIKARLVWRCRLRPIGAEIYLRERILLTQLTQSKKRLMTQAKLIVAFIDHNLLHESLLSSSLSEFSTSRSS